MSQAGALLSALLHRLCQLQQLRSWQFFQQAAAQHSQYDSFPSLSIAYILGSEREQPLHHSKAPRRASPPTPVLCGHRHHALSSRSCLSAEDLLAAVAHACSTPISVPQERLLAVELAGLPAALFTTSTAREQRLRLLPRWMATLQMVAKLNRGRPTVAIVASGDRNPSTFQAAMLRGGLLTADRLLHLCFTHRVDSCIHSILLHLQQVSEGAVMSKLSGRGAVTTWTP